MAALDPRDAVFDAVAQRAADDPHVFVLTNDMGALGLDALRAARPAQVINVGIAEQNMISVAAGLALGGSLVFTYGILSHVTARCYEQLRLDVCAHRLSVVGLGVGAGLSYGADGPTHHGIYDVGMLRALPGMAVYNPADGPTAGAVVHDAAATGGPSFIRMDKEAPSPYGTLSAAELAAGARVVTRGDDALILATGCSVGRAVEAAEHLRRTGIEATVVDCFRLQPFPETMVRALLAKAPLVLTVEEHVSTGGLGSIVAEVLAEEPRRVPFRRLALPHDLYLGATARAGAEQAAGIDAAGIAGAVRRLRGRSPARAASSAAFEEARP